MLRQDDQAIDWLRRGSAMGPDLPYALAILAAVLALNGNDVDAHRALERYLAASGIRTIAQWKAAPQRAVDQGILRGLRAVERHLSTQAADQDNPRGWLHTYIDAS